MTSTSMAVRRVAAVPARTATNAWRAVADLIAVPGSTAPATLLSVGGVASVLIAEAHTRDCHVQMLIRDGQTRVCQGLRRSRPRSAKTVVSDPATP